MTAVSGGALLVWARFDHETDRSELLAALLDHRGTPIGAPRLLRRTSGEVLAVAVSRDSDAAWLAWISLLASDPRPRGLLAAMRVRTDLSTISAPLTLHQFSSEQLELGTPDLEILSLSDGTAAVAATGAEAPCIDIVENRPTDCPGFDLFWVRPDGTSTHAHHFGVDGGDPRLGTLVDIGSGVVLDAWAWHGGPTFASVFARRGQLASKPPVPLVTCRPPFARVVTDNLLVTLCPEDYADERERCVVDGIPAMEGSCDHLHRVRLDLPIRPPAAIKDALTSSRRRCHAGHPVLDVAWKGGRLRIDPRHPDALRDLELGVWTERHALTVTGDGKGERRRCATNGTLAVDAPLDLTALLAAPADPRRPRLTEGGAPE